MRRRQIAVVDDSPQIRESLTRLFHSMGMEARAFPSAEAFLADGELDSLCCLITDVKMEGMSGYELQQLLLGRGMKVPMIFLSAYHDPRSAAEAIARGALAVLWKPIDGGELLDWVAKAIEAEGRPD